MFILSIFTIKLKDEFVLFIFSVSFRYMYVWFACLSQTDFLLDAHIDTCRNVYGRAAAAHLWTFSHKRKFYANFVPIH